MLVRVKICPAMLVRVIVALAGFIATDFARIWRSEGFGMIVARTDIASQLTAGKAAW